MVKITLLRHGQSEYNATRDPTIIDAKLTDHGKELAAAVEPGSSIVYINLMYHARVFPFH